MADVVLAEADGQVWLVLGDEHIGEVLLGELPDGVTAEVIRVENRAAVMKLWWQLNPIASADRQPWIINPLLAPRVRGLAEPGRRSIAFTPWSAMLGDEAQGAISDMAKESGGLVLRQFAASEQAPGHADLQRLRLQLVRGALQRAGFDPARVTEQVHAAAGAADGERMDILAGEAALEGG